ncbi:hypothetical protein H4219_003107 [Mycoemilia scoparia]|uniref:Uncharacterized protein n=1 Tax=Mycoemilia scoparia TaxID=417184 RepID=A0A9W8A569_9FUNG|nr:hypothetical protein H4219_003107 [Mycoemilia scoparia]
MSGQGRPLTRPHTANGSQNTNANSNDDDIQISFNLNHEVEKAWETAWKKMQPWAVFSTSTSTSPTSDTSENIRQLATASSVTDAQIAEGKPSTISSASRGRTISIKERLALPQEPPGMASVIRNSNRRSPPPLPLLGFNNDENSAGADDSLRHRALTSTTATSATYTNNMAPYLSQSTNEGDNAGEVPPPCMRICLSQQRPGAPKPFQPQHSYHRHNKSSQSIPLKSIISPPAYKIHHHPYSTHHNRSGPKLVGDGASGRSDEASELYPIPEKRRTFHQMPTSGNTSWGNKSRSQKGSCATSTTTSSQPSPIDSTAGCSRGHEGKAEVIPLSSSPSYTEVRLESIHNQVNKLVQELTVHYNNRSSFHDSGSLSDGEISVTSSIANNPHCEVFRTKKRPENTGYRMRFIDNDTSSSASEADVDDPKPPLHAYPASVPSSAGLSPSNKCDMTANVRLSKSERPNNTTVPFPNIALDPQFQRHRLSTSAHSRTSSAPNCNDDIVSRLHNAETQIESLNRYIEMMASIIQSLKTQRETLIRSLDSANESNKKMAHKLQFYSKRRRESPLWKLNPRKKQRPMSVNPGKSSKRSKTAVKPNKKPENAHVDNMDFPLSPTTITESVQSTNSKDLPNECPPTPNTESICSGSYNTNSAFPTAELSESIRSVQAAQDAIKVLNDGDFSEASYCSSTVKASSQHTISSLAPSNTSTAKTQTTVRSRKVGRSRRPEEWELRCKRRLGGISKDWSELQDRWELWASTYTNLLDNSNKDPENTVMNGGLADHGYHRNSLVSLKSSAKTADSKSKRSGRGSSSNTPKLLEAFYRAVSSQLKAAGYIIRSTHQLIKYALNSSCPFKHHSSSSHSYRISSTSSNVLYPDYYNTHSNNNKSNVLLLSGVTLASSTFSSPDPAHNNLNSSTFTSTNTTNDNASNNTAATKTNTGLPSALMTKPRRPRINSQTFNTDNNQHHVLII